MKILMIFTGGTIGSSVKDGYICVDEKNMKRLVDEACKNTSAADIEISVINPYTILSETLNGRHIAKLVECINENAGNFDGIIVCHGTDTLQYTAVALKFAFSDLPIPIVLVSSNYVLEDERSNGRDNLRAAVEFITGRSDSPGLMNRMRRGGVWVSYKNAGMPVKMYEPFELLPHQAYDDRLYTLDLSNDENLDTRKFAVNTENIDTEKFAANTENIDTEKFTANTENYDAKRMNVACLSLGEKSGILWIKAYPGICYTDYLNPVKKPTGILLDTYHSGTLNTSDESLRELAKWARENAVPICLVGLAPGISYETTRVYGEMGIKVFGKISPVTAYMYMWLTGTLKGDANV
jgi:L-asparaginase